MKDELNKDIEMTNTTEQVEIIKNIMSASTTLVDAAINTVVVENSIGLACVVALLYVTSKIHVKCEDEVEQNVFKVLRTLILIGLLALSACAINTIVNPLPHAVQFLLSRY